MLDRTMRRIHKAAEQRLRHCDSSPIATTRRPTGLAPGANERRLIGLTNGGQIMTLRPPQLSFLHDLLLFSVSLAVPVEKRNLADGSGHFRIIRRALGGADSCQTMAEAMQEGRGNMLAGSVVVAAALAIAITVWPLGTQNSLGTPKGGANRTTASDTTGSRGAPAQRAAESRSARMIRQERM
jgi:hypothetical protein